MALEHGGLALQLLGVVILGEGDVDFRVLAGGGADELDLKAGDEGVGADLQTVLLVLAALEGHAVDEAFIVQHHGIPELGGALGGLDGGVAVAELVDLHIHLGGVHLGFLPHGGQALVLAQLHLGIEHAVDIQGEGLVLLHLGVLNGRAGHDLQFLFLHGEIIGLGSQIIDGLLMEHAFSVHGFHDLPGGLALAETGDLDALSVLVEDLDHGRLKFLRGNGNGDQRAVLFFLFDVFDFHCGSSSQC